MDAGINVKRLLHTLVPFMVMTAVQKGLLLLIAGSGTPDAGEELLAFLPSAAAAAALFRVRTYSPDPNGEEAVGPLVPRSAGVCVLHTLAAAAAMVGLMFAVSALMHGQAAVYDSPAGGGVETTLLSALSLLLIHPVAEELLFRRAFYGELRLMNPMFACLAQAVMFAIVHRTVDSMVYALCAGVVLGILAERSGRIWPAVVAHTFINLRSFVCVTWLAERGGIRRISDIVLLVLGGAAFVCALCLPGPKPEAEPENGEAEA